ncbi:MAG: response regulator transcription factor [Comamonadaceae bacterium]|nr:response regulator transcription factor [Comamonadaceae bacterium]
MRIAVLEDDDNQRDWMNSFLLALGHVCHPFAASEGLLRELRRENFDLLILDWNVPDMSGLDVVRWVRANIKARVPVLFVTSHVDEADLVEALKAGADDYMCKPVRVPELLARLHALLRRAYPEQTGEVLASGDYVFDQKAKTLSFRGQLLELKHREYELAYLLFSRMGELLSRKYLQEQPLGCGRKRARGRGLQRGPGRCEPGLIDAQQAWAMGLRRIGRKAAMCFATL